MFDQKKRRDIDKETMFNKIMPTYLLDPASDEEDIRAETVQKVIVKPGEEPKEPKKPAAPVFPPEEEIPGPPPAPEKPSVEPAPPKAESKPADIDDLLHELETPKAAPVRTADQPRYINLTEMLVFEKLDGMIEKFKCCKCEACRQAIVLHALNTLSPNYLYATEAAAKDVVSRLDSSAVISCIIQAIMQTRTNPPHPVIHT